MNNPRMNRMPLKSLVAGLLLLTSINAKAEDKRESAAAAVVVAPVLANPGDPKPSATTEKSLPILYSASSPVRLGQRIELCNEEQRGRTPVSCGLRSDALGVPADTLAVPPPEDRREKEGMSTGTKVLLVYVGVAVVTSIVAASVMSGKGSSSALLPSYGVGGPSSGNGWGPGGR